MKNLLFLLVFFTGAVPIILSASFKYYLIQQEKTWSDAQAYCQATYTDLALAKSNDDMEQLQNEADKQNFTSRAWIGMYNDVTSWRWSFQNEPLGNMIQWCQGQPDNYQGHESCGVKKKCGLNDAHCGLPCPFVCFDDSNYGSGRYIYMSKPMTWLGAQSYCRQYHTDLASVRNTTENSVIGGLIKQVAWIGLFRDTWKWVDHSDVSNTIWMPEKPDNALGNENCGYLNNSHAADAQCADIMPFFCYADITKQYIIRMRIQSNRDVNNLTVKVTIIEQLKQKLKDHGLTENITVNWRVQKNGVIFHKDKEINIQSADEQCSNIKPFFLYSEFTKKQFLKVKIQSNRDVNDRGVKAATLEQIRQNLVDHGMAVNIRVNWREQPNGVIFHKEKKEMRAGSSCSPVAPQIQNWGVRILPMECVWGLHVLLLLCGSPLIHVWDPLYY